MEPTVKSEPCEELYSAQEIVSEDSNQPSSLQSHSQTNLKRLYHESEDNSALSGKVNQHLSNNFSYQSYELSSAPQHMQDSFKTEELIQNIMELAGRPPKKHKRLEDNVLFNPPFFKLVEELLSPLSDAISARCYSCNKVVKGNRSVSSNFIKHMKRSHAETYKLYDGYKTKSYYLPDLPSKKPASIPENAASGSDSTTANSNDDTNQFIESSTVNEGSADLNDSSDDNEDLANATNETSNTAFELSAKSLETSNTAFELSAKSLETLGNLIDSKIKTFFKQKEDEKLSSLIYPNRTCDVGSNSALTELRLEIDNLKKECSELRSAVQKSQASKRQLQNELQTVDKLLHQRKLIIRNIIVRDPENPIKSVEKLFKEIMHLDNIKIVHCCIIPSVKASMALNKETVSIELASPQDCKAIFRQTQKLKNTGIFIESEISPFQQKRKNKLMVLRKELLRRKPDLKVLVRGTTLIVNGKNFHWDDVEGLCHDCKYEAIDLTGIAYLNLLSGLDLKEFVTFLQNYNVQTG